MQSSFLFFVKIFSGVWFKTASQDDLLINESVRGPESGFPFLGLVARVFFHHFHFNRTVLKLKEREVLPAFLTETYYRNFWTAFHASFVILTGSYPWVLAKLIAFAKAQKNPSSPLLVENVNGFAPACQGQRLPSALTKTASLPGVSFSGWRVANRMMRTLPMSRIFTFISSPFGILNPSTLFFLSSKKPARAGLRN